MKRKRKLQKQRDRQIQMVNQITKLFLNSLYGKLFLNSAYGKSVYADTDSTEITPEETNYIEQDNAIIQDFFKKQEV